MKIAAILVGVLLSITCSQPEIKTESRETERPRLLRPSQPGCDGPRMTSAGNFLPEFRDRPAAVFTVCPGPRIGTVVAQATVGTDGLPHHARIVKSVDPCLDGALLTAVNASRFCPAERGGKAFETTVKFTADVHTQEAQTLFILGSQE